MTAGAVLSFACGSRASRLARRNSQGVAGAAGIVIVAITVGLLAAWNMSRNAKAERVVAQPRFRSTPHAQELSDVVGSAARPHAHVRVLGHHTDAWQIAVTRLADGQSVAWLAVPPEQSVGIDIPRGRYRFTVGPSAPGADGQGRAPEAIDATLDAGGLVVDLNRRGSVGVPFRGAGD